MKVRDAAVAGLNDTAQAAADEVRSQRPDSRGAVIARAATGSNPGNPMQVRWGLFPAPTGDPWYEVFLEYGGARVMPDAAKRRAADRFYPELASKIKGHFGG